MSLDTLHQTLQRLGLKLPPPPKPVGAYRPVMLAGGFAYLSGQISKDAQGKVVTGKVGKDLTLEAGKRAAQLAALQAVSLIQGEIGFEKVEQVVRVAGFIQSADGFYAQSEVMNSASELLVEIFGDRGRHARTSIGVTSLPLNAAVEIEVTVKLR
jgi:enamine deaminase RidA (YjgF/YER057c/UK114 family)